VNDCGSKDSILLLSNYFVFSTGMAGRTGFIGSTGSTLRNRFSSFGHSGYFLDENGRPTDDYMRRHWAPLLITDGPAPAFDFRKPPTTLDTFTEGLATYSGQIKFAAYATPLVVIASVFYGLWVNAETQRQVKERVAENAAYTASNFIYKTFGNSSGQIEMRPAFKQMLLSEAKSALNELDGVAPTADTVRQRGLAAVLIEQSALNTDRGKSTDGVADATRAIEILKNLGKNRESYAEIQFDLATAYDRLGAATMKNEDYLAAIDAINESAALLQQLIASGTTTEKLLKNLAANKEKLGSIYAADHSLDRASESFAASCELRSRLTRMFADRVDLKLDLGRCYLETGQILLMKEKLGEAQADLEQGLAITERLPARIDVLLLLARTHQRLGELDEKRAAASSGEGPNWEAHYRRALEIIKSITMVESDRPDVTGSYTEVVTNLGFLLARTGRAAEAKSLYQDCLMYVDTGAVANIDLSVMKARMRIAIGDIERDAGNLVLARTDYYEAIKGLERFEASHLASALWRTNLLNAYRRASDASFKICDEPQPSADGECRYTEPWQIASRRSRLAGSIPRLSELQREAYADILSEESWYALFANEYARAVAASEQAVSQFPNRIPEALNWIKINQAHSLMFAGNLEAARAIYRMNWEDAKAREIIREDFKTMRRRQKCHSLMREIAPELPACNMSLAE
jgi:tetratricopeptide (TPR) repeat protein